MIVPGLVAVIMMIIAAMLTSLTIAREWERGTMEQLAATPVTRLEVVLGKLLPYLAIGLVDVAAISVLGVVALRRAVPRQRRCCSSRSRSSSSAAALGLGLFISAAARSQVLATQMALVLTFLPAFLLSGFMFAIENMPPVLRALTYLVPARYFLVVTRGIFLKGVGIEVLRVPGPADARLRRPRPRRSPCARSARSSTEMRAALGRIGWMVRKELRQVFRDPRMARVVIIAPVIQLLVFGYAVSTDVRAHRDHRRSTATRAATSRELARRLHRRRLLRRSWRSPRATPSSPTPSTTAAPRSRWSFPPATPATSPPGRRGCSCSSTAPTRTRRRWPRATPSASSRRSRSRAPSRGRPPPLDVRLRAWYNPDLASRNYNVPAVIGLLLSLVCQLLTALAVVREREIGTLEQLEVSPLTAGELILGKTIPFALIALVDLVLITAVALLWFRVPFRGSPLLLLVAHAALRRLRARHRPARSRRSRRPSRRPSSPPSCSSCRWCCSPASCSRSPACRSSSSG